MDVIDLEQRFADLKARCAKLPAEDQDRALDGCAQVLTLCELPHEPGEPVSLSVAVAQPSGVTHKSG